MGRIKRPKSAVGTGPRIRHRRSQPRNVTGSDDRRRPLGPISLADASLIVGPGMIPRPVACHSAMEHRETLLRVLEDCVEKAEHAPLSLGETLINLKTSALALSTVLLCLPFLQPVTLGPLSSLGGLVLASLGWQLMQGRQVMWLPDKIYSFKPSTKSWERLLGVCRWLVKLLAKITRERLVSWVDGRKGERLCGSLVAVGGILLVIPAPILPFNNTLPALAMLFAAVALLERDGLMVLVSIFFQIATIAYFGAFFYALYFLGTNAKDWFKSLIPGIFS